jgi:L-aminopeptidase/D-esterase-like protein
MRTGVTAILPRPGTTPQPVWAGHYALNGNGEMTGTHWINDAGYFLGPILITNTHGIGACHIWRDAMDDRPLRRVFREGTCLGHAGGGRNL